MSACDFMIHIYISAFLLSVLLSHSHYQFEILRRYVFLLTVFYCLSLTVPLAHFFVSLVQVLSLRGYGFILMVYTPPMHDSDISTTRLSVSQLYRDFLPRRYHLAFDSSL